MEKDFSTVSSEKGFVKLGASGLLVSRLGVGTWAWGDSAWGFGVTSNESDIAEAFKASVAEGVNFFDTAEIYGEGDSERFLGKFLKGYGENVVVATKYAPTRRRIPGFKLSSALNASLKRLGLQRVDLYQLHWYNRLMSPRLLASGLAQAFNEGLIRAVGVSNYSAEQMMRFQDLLGKHGVPLASNQVQYSLLHRVPERNGLTAASKERNISLIAYSPIAMGILSGKYSEKNPPPGGRAARYPRDFLRKVSPLIGLLGEIGSAHGGKTPSQVALAWVIGRGFVPIPGAKNASQARENCLSLAWSLNADETSALEKTSDSIQPVPI